MKFNVYYNSILQDMMTNVRVLYAHIIVSDLVFHDMPNYTHFNVLPCE